MPAHGQTPPSPRGPPCRRGGGFTLIEVLVATTLGALLLIAAASSASLFGRQVEYLNSDTQDEAAEALADMSHDARYAWCAQVPDPRRLELYDSAGGKTTYAVEEGALTVTRPDGSQGVVSSAITAATFTAQNVERYREDAPVQRSATVWAQDAPMLASPEAYVVLPGEQVGLGFMVHSAAPVAGSVAGVQEQTLSATLSLLSLRLAAVSPAQGSMTIRLHRARGPGDSRPEGSSLGQVTVALAALPAATTTTNLGGSGLKNTTGTSSGGSGSSGSSGSGGNGNNGNGNGGNGNGGNGQSNGNGGDGSGDGGSSGGGTGAGSGGSTALLVLPPDTSVPIDLTPLAATVTPGRAYTLVFDNTAADPVALEGFVLASADLSEVCLGSGGAGYAGQPVSVPRSLDGSVTMTRTLATPVARSVLVELTNASGATLSGTVSVLGANIVQDAWLGAVPGELGP